MDGGPPPGTRAAAALAEPSLDTPPRLNIGDEGERSFSPWQVQLGSYTVVPPAGDVPGEQVAGDVDVPRERSGECGSNMSSPVVARLGGGSTFRALSGSRPGVQAAVRARANYESALLQAMRRQMEVFEERVNSQIAKIQNQNDRLSQVAVSRLEEKMSAAEAAGPKFDRRIAELSGNVKGLSEEMQAQIRRVDSLDDRVWDAHQQVKEELRQRVGDLDQHLQKVSSGLRISTVSLEDAQKRVYQRLQRLEADAESRFAVQEDTRGGFEALCRRLQALEDIRMGDAANVLAIADAQRRSTPRAGRTPRDEPGAGTQLRLLEQRVQDLSSQSDRVFQDTHDVHARLAAHEMQMGTLRTLLENREEQLKKVAERWERGDWEGKLDFARQAAQEAASDRIAQQERLELLLRRAEHQESNVEELREAHERLALWVRSQSASGGVSPGGLGDADEADMRSGEAPSLLASLWADGTINEELRLLRGDVGECEGRLNSFEEEMQAMRRDNELGPRVAALVDQLKDLVPKVIEHEKRIGDLAANQLPPDSAPQRVDDLEAKVNELVHSLASAKDASEAQLRELREEAAAEGGALRRELGEARVAADSAKTCAEGASVAVAEGLRLLAERGPEPGRLEQTAAEVASLRTDVVSLKALESALGECAGSVAGLRGEVEELRSSRNAVEPEKAAVEPPLDKQDLEALRLELEAVQAAVAERGKEQGMKLQLELEGATGLLQEGLARVSDQADSTQKQVQDTLGNLMVLKDEVDALRGPSQELEMLRAELVALKSREGPAQEFEALRAEIAALKSREGPSEELEALRADIAALKSREGPADELETIRAELATLRSREGPSAELETVRAEIATLKSREGPSAEIETLRAEIAAMKNPDGRSGELEALRAEIVASTSRDGVLEDVELLRGEISALKSREGEASALEQRLRGCEGALAEFHGLSQEVAELKLAAPVTALAEEAARDLQAFREEMAMLKRQGLHEELKAALKARAERLTPGEATSAPGAAVVDQTVLQHLETDVAALRASVEALALSYGCGGGGGGAGASEGDGERFRELAELALAVKKDEEQEDLAQQRLLARIDELCERLAEVDGAVASMGGGLAGSAGLPAAPAELCEKLDGLTRQVEAFREKVEGLARQVEDMGATERQIQAQFGEFVSRFAQPTGNGAGGAAAKDLE